jgi:hypothetical protein
MTALLVIGASAWFAPDSGVPQLSLNRGDSPAPPALPPPPSPFGSRSPTETWMRASNKNQTVVDECRRKGPESRCPQSANSGNTLPLRLLVAVLRLLPQVRSPNHPGPAECLVPRPFGAGGISAAHQPRKALVSSRRAAQRATAAGNGRRAGHRGCSSPSSGCPASRAARPLHRFPWP